MITKEWALILFTVLSQAAIGAFLLLTIFRQRNTDREMDPTYRKAVWPLAGMTLVAILASLVHLGRPGLALYALENLGSSWLSREIFFTGGFFVLLLSSVVAENTPLVRRVIAWLAVLSGAAAVVSMASIYQFSMIPAWQGFNTYVAFVTTALLLGSVTAAGLLLLFGRGHGEVARNLAALVWIGAATLVVEAIAYPFYLLALQDGSKAAQASLALMGGKYMLVAVLRWALLLVGGLLPLVLIGRRLAAGNRAAGLVYTALAFIMAGELIGRFLFYATGIKIGIG